MSTTRSRDDRALWFAVSGGPIAWTIDSLAALAIDHDYCAHGPRPGGTAVEAFVPLLAIGVAAMAITVLAGYTGWRHLRGIPDTGKGDTDDDRRRFMARFALGVSALTLFGILLRTITVLFLSPAAC